MQFEVLRPFTWAGSALDRGDILEISDESPKIGSLVRAKFIRFEGETLPSYTQRKEAKVLIANKVAHNIEVETQPEPAVVGDSTGKVVSLSPREVVRQAKAAAKLSSGNL